ncbi:hypothetical protein M1590_03820 [Candidatus Marsarchaeota archaeon]|nr:hypothetical protein [Candidatus Marsarchaeota archaeon]
MFHLGSPRRLRVGGCHRRSPVVLEGIKSGRRYVDGILMYKRIGGS